MQIAAIDLYELLKAKIGEKEAKALVAFVETETNEKALQAVKPIIDENKNGFKNDINSLKEYMNKVFATKEDLANTRADLIKWMFIFIVGQTGIIITVLKLFFN